MENNLKKENKRLKFLVFIVFILFFAISIEIPGNSKLVLANLSLTNLSNKLIMSNDHASLEFFITVISNKSSDPLLFTIKDVYLSYYHVIRERSEIRDINPDWRISLLDNNNKKILDSKLIASRPDIDSLNLRYNDSLIVLRLYGLIPYDYHARFITLYFKNRFLKKFYLNLCNQNHKCEPNENYLSCPVDCDARKKDNLCVSDKDQVCDTDCLKGFDPDCNSGLRWYGLLIVLLVVLSLFLLGYFYIRERHKRENKIY